MTDKKFIVGNWKMNLSPQEAASLVHDISNNFTAHAQCEMVLCPPFPYLLPSAAALANTQIALGAQDISNQDKGAFTGDVAGGMLKDCGCKYVIIGHSERREYHNEDAELLIAKLEQAFKQQLIPILCLGEPLAMREAGQADEFLHSQLEQVLAKLANHPQIKQLIIAYEPIWAIGTGAIATDDIIWQTHAAIKHCLKAYQLTGSAVLYGGSVKAANAGAILGLDNVDGVLVGGASLDAGGFIEIYASAAQFV